MPRSTLALVVLLLALAIASGSSAAQAPAASTVYVAHRDPRLCPSPRCGGYWVAIANAARTHCLDGLRHPSCYVARLVDLEGRPVGAVPDGSLVHGTLVAGADDLADLVVATVFSAIGTTAPSGRYYRVVDTGTRCVRAPCFTFRVTPVNGAARTAVSGVDLAASGATPRDVARAKSELDSRGGLYVRGRFQRTSDGGRVIRALRIYLRAPRPRV